MSGFSGTVDKATADMQVKTKNPGRLSFGYLLGAAGVLAGMALERYASHLRYHHGIPTVQVVGVVIFMVSALFCAGIAVQRMGCWLEAAERIAVRSRQRSIFLVLIAVIAISIPVVVKLEPRCTPELPIAGIIAIVICLRAVLRSTVS